MATIARITAVRMTAMMVRTTTMTAAMATAVAAAFLPEADKIM
jgi:hypothetical protein